MTGVPRIVVVGSVNADLMLRCPHLPGRGETVVGSDFVVTPGGKGANQAVAAARLGADVRFVGSVGDDAFGRSARAALEAEGVDTTHLATLGNVPTGVALVMVDDAGDNMIAVAAGANHHLDAARLDAAQSVFEGAALVVCQLELPLSVVAHAGVLAQRHGVPLLLNPAPAAALPESLVRSLAYLVPNEGEAALLSGVAINDVASAQAAAARLRAAGAACVIVTLGARGVVCASDAGEAASPALPVAAIDTTGAGDAFVGAFAVARSRGQPLPESIAFAQRAAAWSVQRRGAQAAMPYADDLDGADPHSA